MPASPELQTCIVESTRIRVTAVETLFSIKILNSFFKKRELIRKKKEKKDKTCYLIFVKYIHVFDLNLHAICLILNSPSKNASASCINISLYTLSTNYIKTN